MKMQCGTTARDKAATRERGTVLVLSMVVLAAMMTLAAALYGFATASNHEVASYQDGRRAFYLAEAGLSEAMVALRAGSKGGVASQAAPAYQAGGVFWVTSTDLGGKRYRLVSTGMVGSGRAALELIVEDQTQAPLFPSVLNSQDVLTLNANVTIDSYDSMLGTYASQQVNSYAGIPYAKSNGDVTSNNNIVLNSQARVFGDATPGPGYGVSLAFGSYVSGSTAAAPNPFAFDPIVVPSYPITGAYTVAAGATQTISPGNFGFANFTLGKACHLTIKGPANLVVNDFVGGKDARLHIDASNGPVTIYVKGSYTHFANFEAQPVSGSPMALAFMVQGSQDVVFPASTKVRGAYYVPNANVLFANLNEAWGAFCAKRISMSSSMRFHYDEDLSKYWETTGSGKDPIQVLTWQRTGSPTAVLSDRRDPYQVLGVKKALLPSPSAAWNP